jgi:polyhydroxybutyrate depolymerase
MTRNLTATALALCLFAPAAQAGCDGTPTPCQTPNGTYHIERPTTPGPHPAVLFLHGFGGSGAGTLRNRGMVTTLLSRGYAVIAPDGQPRQGQLSGNGLTWDFHPDRPARRDEAAFLAELADDAARRFDLDRDRMLLAGFSIGGSMVSYAACARPDDFAAFAPVAGSFWRPHPTGCTGPVRLLHTHGWADMTVPLEGRVLGSGFAQGDVFAALDLWRKVDGCTALRPDGLKGKGLYQIREWTDCTTGADLAFALHPGAHGIPEGWATLALDWFEGRP